MMHEITVVGQNQVTEIDTVVILLCNVISSKHGHRYGRI